MSSADAVVCVAFERRHAHAISCARESAEDAACGSGGAPAVPRAPLHCLGIARARAICKNIKFGCISLTRRAMHHLASACILTLRRTPQPPRVAF